MLKTQKAIEEDPEQAAEAAGLRYVSDQKPGMTRRKKGRGFVYYDQNGHRIKGGALLKRIRSIVIPPAWERVWICPSVNGHLQATGFDTKGRKQYKYHSTWRLVRDEAKFERLLLFAGVLPKLRAKVNRDMRRTDLSREKIVATVVRLLELSLIRVGNEEYAKENNSFGLTTMRNRHAKINGSMVRFHFRGKGGKEHTVEVTDRRVAKIVRNCQELPGQHLFEYKDREGQIHSIGSEDVNDYLQALTKQPFRCETPDKILRRSHQI